MSTIINIPLAAKNTTQLQNFNEIWKLRYRRFTFVTGASRLSITDG
ncbi:MAG: hypothetical protein K2G85_07670 [Muribaculaceae bacterium]|nr:hypothetical protein [Muribaculaceae bacterium]